MKPIRCLILEDEPLAQEVIENYIGRLPFLSLVAKCDNALDAYSHLGNNSIDLLFCDIEMPRITGIEFLRSLSHKPHVVMTTAYNEYALEGFDLDVADYLLKPISFERFLRAVQKVKERMEGKEALQYQHKSQQQDIPAAAPRAKEDYMFIKENNNLVKVKHASIQYVEGMKDYIKVYLNDRMIVTYMTLKKMEEALPDDFLRIHKSYIVNLNAIASIEGNMIRLENKTELPIGLQSRAEVMEIINRKVLTK